MHRPKISWLLCLLAACVLALVMCTAPRASADTLSLPAGVPLDGGPLEVQGILSGLAVNQSHVAADDRSQRFDVDNTQFLLQKDTGAWQFLVQGGAYTFPTVGEPFTDTPDVLKNLYGSVPVAYVKYAISESASLQAGKFPTLLGAEGIWPWGNYNIERGLLWNLENTITRGAQFNYSQGAFNVSLAWTDGFYSGHFNNLTGLVSYSLDSADTLSVVAYDTLRPTASSSTATPEALNNARIYNLIYTHTTGNWTLTPYLQYNFSPACSALGYTHDNSSTGVALLVDYAASKTWSVGARAEYLTSSSVGNTSPNNNLLGYGSSSRVWTLTFTPTWQAGDWFARAELSYVHLSRFDSGLGFGSTGDQADQTRALLEAGVVF